MIGKSVIALLAFIVIVIIMTLMKRRISEALILGFLVVCGFTGTEFFANFFAALKYGATQTVLFAALAFVYMAYLMNKTGVIGRLINILNSLVGRVPGGSGYVSTLGSALFGCVSGSTTGCASAVGSITIPWMEASGFSKGHASCLVAGNAGLSVIFPPSTNFLLYLGMTVVASEVTSGALYISCFTAALWLLLIRMLVVFYFAKKDKLKGIPKDQIMPLSKAWKENWTSVLIFVGALLPIVATVGPISNFFESRPNFGADGIDSINLILWIPMLIIVIVLIEGRKYLPKDFKGWVKFNSNAIGQFSDLGTLLICSYAASRVLTNMGLQEDMAAIFGLLSGLPSIVTILAVCILVALLAGPFQSTAVTTSIGAVSYMALRSVGVNPYVAVCVLMIICGCEGAIPPNSAPLFISGGISGMKDPGSQFKNLFFLYGIPAIILGLLMCLGIVPIYVG